MDNSKWLGISTGGKQGNFKWLFLQYTRSFPTALCWILTACFRGSLKGASGARMNKKIGRAVGAIAGGRRWSQEKDNHPHVIAVSSAEDWQSLSRTLSMWGHKWRHLGEDLLALQFPLLRAWVLFGTSLWAHPYYVSSSAFKGCIWHLSHSAFIKNHYQMLERKPAKWSCGIEK